MESYRYSDDDIQEEDIQMEEENDRRLRQAINYLKNHGGPDSFELYRDRVNRINDLIINRYVDEGRLFDVDMYRELRRMVDSQLEAFNRSTENVIEVSSDESLDSLSSGDPDVQMSGALYRDDADDPATPERSPRRRASLTPSPPPAPRPRSRFWKASGKDLGPPLPRPSFREEPPTAEIGSIQWRYGGPRNTAEDWKRNFPPILPFGESLSIREMESRQINYDLAMGPFATPEQAMAKRPDMYENPNKEGSYDTGARFKLLRNTETRREVERVLGDGMSFLRSVVREFNDAGGKGIQVKKDYAPRVFLETVHVPRRNAPRRPSTGLGPSPAGSGRRSSAPTGTYLV